MATAAEILSETAETVTIRADQILHDELQKWLVAMVKENLKVEEFVCNEFTHSDTNDFKDYIDKRDSTILVALVKTFPQIEDAKIPEYTEEIVIDIDDTLFEQVEEKHDVKPAVKFQTKKSTKKTTKTKKLMRRSRSVTPKRRSRSRSSPKRRSATSTKSSKSKAKSKSTSPKKETKSKDASKMEKSDTKSVRHSIVSQNLSLPKQPERRTSVHSKDSDNFRFFMEDELEETAQKAVEETQQYHYETEDHAILELKFLDKDWLENSHDSAVVQKVLYLWRKSNNSNLEWPSEINFESLSETLLEFYYVGVIFNYTSLTCAVESLLEILNDQISDPKEVVALNLAVLAFHITCQPENELETFEIDVLSEFSLYFCKNSTQIVEDFELHINLASDIKSLLAQNDYSRFNDLLTKVNSWIDEGQKILNRENFYKKKDVKNTKSLLDSYCKKYLVAKWLRLDFDAICKFEPNSLLYERLIKNISRWVPYSNLLDEKLNQRRSTLQYLLPLFSLVTVDLEYSVNVDFDLIEMTIQMLLDFCVEFKSVENLRNFVESLCVDLVAVIGYKLQPNNLFTENSLVKDFDVTKELILSTSRHFLSWRQKLSNILKSREGFKESEDNSEQWMKSLNQGLQTTQFLIEFMQMLLPYVNWLNDKSSDDTVIEQREKCLDTLEEMEKELQQVSYDIFSAIGQTSWKRTTANISARLKILEISS